MVAADRNSFNSQLPAEFLREAIYPLQPAKPRASHCQAVHSKINQLSILAGIPITYIGNNTFLGDRSLPVNSPQISKLQETFRALGLRSNLASISVLGHALTSSFEQVRLSALNTLILRGGQAEMSAVLERIDFCNEAELPLLANQIPLLMIPIEAGLADRDPVKRQRSLCAIAKLQIAPLFHHLVETAQAPDDPQQIVAAELLIHLASNLGDWARRAKGRAKDAVRAQLLADIWQSLLRFNDHRISDIVDAWLCASHWDDKLFKEIFTPACGETIHKIAMRQLRHSHRAQIIELMAGIVWSNNPSPESIKELGERQDPVMTSQLAMLVERFGITQMVSKNLNSHVSIQCVEQVDFSNTSNSIKRRCSLLNLLSASNASPDKVLKAITQMLESQDPDAESSCANAIRNLRSLNPEIVVMVLSDCFEVPGMESYEAPPWKTSLRTALERLIELYPHQSEVVRSSIQYVFSDFRCEELIKHLEDWPESHLNAYAKIVRIAEVGYVEFIERDALSQSAVKRSRAIQAVRFLGTENGLEDVVIEAISDKNAKVRTEAIFAIASGRNRQESIDILRPLMQDEDQSVITAANFAISRLEG